MVRYYHGTQKENVEEIRRKGLLSGHITRNIVDTNLYITRHKRIALYYGDVLIRLNIPKSKIIQGYGNAGEFTDPKKPVMELIHKPGIAITKGGEFQENISKE